jgi:hypothetical protein
MDLKRGDVLIDLNAAAALIGVRPDSLRRQAQLGVLRAERIGAAWVLTEREARRYLAEHKGKVGPKPKRPPKATPEPSP